MTNEVHIMTNSFLYINISESPDLTVQMTHLDIILSIRILGHTQIHDNRYCSKGNVI